jgi:hypothetical protein
MLCSEKEISVHRESGLNILLTTGFQVQDYFVPSRKDNFNRYKYDAILCKIDFLGKLILVNKMGNQIIL